MKRHHSLRICVRTDWSTTDTETRRYTNRTHTNKSHLGLSTFSIHVRLQGFCCAVLTQSRQKIYPPPSREKKKEGKKDK